MKIEHISLGIWWPRASMHLKEMYEFLRGNKTPIQGLDNQTLAALRKALEVTDVRFIRDAKADSVRVSCKNIDITISEEGIIVLQKKVQDISVFPKKDLALLEQFFIKKFSPAIKYLFSLGAPLPKELQHIREAYPIILTAQDATAEQLRDFITTEHLEIYSQSDSPKLDVFFGETISIVNIKDSTVLVGELLQNMVFLKEFSLQLTNYLKIHRTIWEKINLIREAKSIAYKDFTRLREEVNNFLKTLSLMKARLQQMEDIIETRKIIQQAKQPNGLDDVKMDRIDNFIGDIKYIKDLWEMTIGYAKDTLHLLESLSQENIQRELSALKFITLIGAITSFFGMNIAFPWEERWPSIFTSSFAVMGVIIVISFAFYYFLKIFIYNRRFKLK